MQVLNSSYAVILEHNNFFVVYLTCFLLYLLQCDGLLTDSSCLQIFQLRSFCYFSFEIFTSIYRWIATIMKFIFLHFSVRSLSKGHFLNSCIVKFSAYWGFDYRKVFIATCFRDSPRSSRVLSFWEFINNRQL